jgi:choline dehydrogenase-like flavoprotein
MNSPGPADVVIVGCGAGGAACAWALARQGVRVTVLEAGPWFDPTRDYRLHQNNWEQTRFPRPGGRGLEYSFAPMQPLDPKHDGLRSWNHVSGSMNRAGVRLGARYDHVQGVGGSTLHFTGEAHRLNPKAMRMGTRHGVAADWPLSYEELEPYYTLAEKTVGVAGPASDPRRPRSEPYPLPPHEPGYASTHLTRGLEQLGLRWTHNSLAVLSRPYDGRPGCNYCANCNRGCPRTDKGSADVTFARKAVASGHCRIVTGATVLGVLPGKADRVEAVLYADENGTRHRVPARAVVLAGGAVATPRLLLLSGKHGEGLGNESGQIGKNFMQTLSWASAGLHPVDLGSHRGLPTDIICWDYNDPEAIPDIPGGCRFSPATAEADLLGPINYAQRVVAGWGRQHKQRMREQFGHVLAVTAIGESLPNPGSFVDLDSSRKDAHGLPVARIHSHLDALDIRRLEFMAGMCRNILQASGTGPIFEESGTYDFFNSTHVFGTCRMGDDPDKSVVDRDGKSHRWRNLFVADASVFPSSGGGEAPSLTIEALAIRTGDCIHSALVKRML